MPAAPTAWVGERPLPDDLRDAVVKPAHAGPRPRGAGGGQPGGAVFGEALSPDEEARLRAEAAERPDAFAVQAAVPLSTTPAWAEGEAAELGGAVGLTPRRLVLRAYTAAVAGGGHAVMPGGLGRVSPSASSRLTSMRRGGWAKDVWVVAGAAEAADRPGGREVPGAVDRAASGLTVPGGSGHLPSRVADNLFWLGRYAERAEGTVRLLRAIGHRHDDPAEAHPGELAALLRALSVVTGVADADAGPAAHPGPGAAGEVLAAVFDPASPHGLASTLACCRRAGGLVRDRLSVDAWRILERLGRGFEDRAASAAASAASFASAASPAPSPAGPADPEDALAEAMELFDGMLLTLAAFAGHGHESFTHEEGWRFLDTGRRIERAVFLAELIRALLVRPVWAAGASGGGGASGGASGGGPVRAAASEGLLLEALLEVGVSSMTYRSRHPALPRVVPVLRLLLFDGTNPRALRWQLDAIRRHLHGLPDAGGRPGEAESVAAAERLAGLLDSTGPEELAAVTGGVRVGLDRLLKEVVEGLPALSDEVSRAYVRLTP